VSTVGDVLIISVFWCCWLVGQCRNSILRGNNELRCCSNRRDSGRLFTIHYWYEN